MATQHPDNAGAPWWHHDPFIPTQDEIEELLLLFTELDIEEYMWDWEGKYVDESVGEKLFSRAEDLFRKHPLGEDYHLTFRIPAFEVGLHRMARAFMNILSMADFTKEIGFAPPVTEMFLPLTTSADQPIAVRKAFREVAEYHRAIFHGAKAKEEELIAKIEVTPLVEDVDSLFNIDAIVGPYWEQLLKEQKKQSCGKRVFLARSDPALNAGLVPAVLAVKAALSTVTELGEKLGFPVYPIIGTGSLPFRGSVNPTYLEPFLTQYAGVRTYSIQSAFRYDYPLEQVRDAIKVIKREAPKRNAERMTEKEKQELREISDMFVEIWKPTIEVLAETINDVAQYIPGRRERLQHIGLFGYSRGVGKVKLPRAIGFTAAFYSLGIPPELIATGRGLKAAKERGLFHLIEKYYPALRDDLKHAGKYLNRENVALLSLKQSIFQEVSKGINAIEEILEIKLGPEKPRHFIHRNITSTIFHRLQEERNEVAIRRDIVEAGIIRCSLG